MERVVIATPRVDVAIELGIRFEQAFGVDFVLIAHGNRKIKFKDVPLLICTTHQLFRWKEWFDVVVIDEIDAFPFQNSKLLQQAVKKSRKKESAIIYLTATPEIKHQQLINSRSEVGIKIPLRFHGYPLPIPATEWIGNWKNKIKKGKVPSNFIQWLITKKKSKQQVLIFFPEIELMLQIANLLSKYTLKIPTVYAGHKKRNFLINDFRKEKSTILFTTTILERGVTFSKVDVGIFGAEHNTFQTSSLIQICGRVGRSIQRPTGEIIFFHNGISKSMKMAINQIKQMNREGEKRIK